MVEEELDGVLAEARISRAFRKLDEALPCSTLRSSVAQACCGGEYTPVNRSPGYMCVPFQFGLLPKTVANAGQSITLKLALRVRVEIAVGSRDP